MDFELVGDLTEVETIALGAGSVNRRGSAVVWQRPLEEMKASLDPPEGWPDWLAELHRYEAHGIAKRVQAQEVLD